ncbi:MAG TPA: DUF58 domain-containing protein [Chitinophagales bacterium]|nr:DUF58 domain-containing protein [Chitinophagales bacterium]
MAKEIANSTDEKRRKLRRIEIKTRKLSTQIFSGSYHSAFKGRGISFSEVREYQYGDDVRAIDWNVTARNRKPFIKVFEEERELTVMLLIDVSQSSFFGTQNEFKNHIIAEISGVIAFSAITNNDKVGVLFFSDTIEKFIPPKKGKSHILRIISEIYDFNPKQTGTNISEALKYFNNVVKKKSIAFLVSDFISGSEADKNDFKKSLNIVGKKHDLIGLHIYDEREANMPDVGLAKVVDSETGAEFWIDTSDKSLRDKYAKNFTENVRNTKDLFGKSGAQLESIKTEDNYVISLMNMFKKREMKR